MRYEVGHFSGFVRGATYKIRCALCVSLCPLWSKKNSHEDTKARRKKSIVMKSYSMLGW